MILLALLLQAQTAVSRIEISPANAEIQVGQSVRLRGRFGLPLNTAEIYRITATLPARDNSPQYRMRNDDERHERVATEDNLEEAPAIAAAAVSQTQEI